MAGGIFMSIYLRWRKKEVISMACKGGKKGRNR
jgi:hypothetical protein